MMHRDYAQVILQVANEIWARTLQRARERWLIEEQLRLTQRAQARTDADKSALRFVPDSLTVT